MQGGTEGTPLGRSRRACLPCCICRANDLLGVVLRDAFIEVATLVLRQVFSVPPRRCARTRYAVPQTRHRSSACLPRGPPFALMPPRTPPAPRRNSGTVSVPPLFCLASGGPANTSRAPHFHPDPSALGRVKRWQTITLNPITLNPITLNLTVGVYMSTPELGPSIHTHTLQNTHLLALSLEQSDAVPEQLCLLLGLGCTMLRRPHIRHRCLHVCQLLLCSFGRK